MSNVNYHLITLAREAAGYTQKDFASAIGVEQGTISKIENGIAVRTSEEIIQKIAYVLDYPVSFFYQEWMPVRVEGHYRRKLSIPAKDIKECKAKMTLAERHLNLLCESIELPEPNYPKWNVEVDGSVAMCAMYLREFWKIPKGRIANITEILEDNGFLIIELDLKEIDGFSILSENNTPLIFVNKNMSGDRYRMTVSHEAFHFILHHGQKISPEREEIIEDEAKEAASEFLLPFKEVENQLRGLNLSKLADLKAYWLVSMQALLVKAGKGKIITTNQYQYLWKQMSAAGYRKKEPIDIPKEKPSLFKELLTTHLEDLKYSREELSTLLQFNKIDDWYFNKGSKLRALRRIA
jgi:Zn-dependent peptidase ImmA (M78 family)/DNA-binding XRE family transcriptional regulator